MLLGFYVPFTEPRLKLCMQVGVVHYCENAHLLRHRSEHTCSSAIYYQMDSVTKALHCKAKYGMNVKMDHTLSDVGDVMLLSNLPSS